MRMRISALVLLALGGSTACNTISGADEIDFTQRPENEFTHLPDCSGSTANIESGPYDISCPDGSVIVGLFGRGALWLDRIGLVCAPVNADDTLGPACITATAGGDGGQPQIATCLPNEVLLGHVNFADTTAPLVHGIRLLCQTIPEWKKGTNWNQRPGLGAYTATEDGRQCIPPEVHGNVYGDIGLVAGNDGMFVLTAGFTCENPP